MMKRLLRTLHGLALSATVFTLLGCAGKDLVFWDEKIPQADLKNPVVEIFCIWQAAEGSDPNGIPTRGFAGQIMFFTRKDRSPVLVDGDIRVYLFDDQGTPEEQGKPIHQFDFLGQAWQKHLQIGTLGPSYHVFIPHMRKNQYQTQGALRVRLIPKEGPPVFSDMVNVTLPGRQRSSESSSPVINDGKPIQVTRSIGDARRPINQDLERLLKLAESQRRPQLPTHDPSVTRTGQTDSAYDQRLSQIEQALHELRAEQAASSQISTRRDRHSAVQHASWNHAPSRRRNPLAQPQRMPNENPQTRSSPSAEEYWPSETETHPLADESAMPGSRGKAVDHQRPPHRAEYVEVPTVRRRYSLSRPGASTDSAGNHPLTGHPLAGGK